MARIEGVPQRHAGLLTRFAYRYSRRKVGKVMEPLAITAHNQQIMLAMGGYEYFLDRARAVDSRLKALAGIKAAALVGCPF